MSTKYTLIAFIMLLAVSTLTSCEGKKVKEVLWDSGPIGNLKHEGTYKGKVRVYTISWIDDTATPSEEKIVFIKGQT